jgi:hypothetical protein
MKFTIHFTVALLLVLSATLIVQAQTQEYYQLRTYTFETDAQIKATDNYLEKAFIPALKRLKIKSVGVFKFRNDQGEPINKTLVLIPFTSMSQFLSLEENLEKDNMHNKSGKEFLDASYDQAPYTRIESILMKAFVDMPKMEPSKVKGSRKNRIYELRSYESATQAYYTRKVDMFNAGGEVKLFDRLGFNAVFYAEVISGPKMPNLMYMSTFENQEKRDDLWKQFFSSPEWEKLKGIEKYKKTVSKADKYFLYPTEYSDY